MRIAVSADHAGFEFKKAVVSQLLAGGHDVIDLGPHELDPGDDYPDRALAVAESVLSGDAERGILLCGSGIGASIAASKVPGIRAALCHDSYSARQSVEHDDANVLCIGPRVVGPELGRDLIETWLAARFSGAERHLRRLNKIQAIEDRLLRLPASPDVTDGR
jgi:ribose 5-phosphate isomerase B